MNTLLTQTLNQLDVLIEPLTYDELSDQFSNLKNVELSNLDSKDLVTFTANLDHSSLNKTNNLFSEASILVAKWIEINYSDKDIYDLEMDYQEMSKLYKEKGRVPFSICEGIKFAINRKKAQEVDETFLQFTIPYFKEFSRGSSYSSENPDGEDSTIQKIEQLIYLLEGSKIASEVVFMNDAVGEKVDLNDEGESSEDVFKIQIINFLTANNIGFKMLNNNIEDNSKFNSIEITSHNIRILFTSIEKELANKSPEDRSRFENRNDTGKIQERKGGSVLMGMERPINESTKNSVRLFMDSDSTIPVASFVGDAIYSIVKKGHTAYLANLRNEFGIESRLPSEEIDTTNDKVQRRKTFFSGLLVPALFSELSGVYNYQGTTQLPAKAFSGNVDFQKSKLTTVQPDIDLGLITVLLDHCNNNNGSIDSGAITLRDNIQSSTMTTNDLSSEWEKTYGPIFRSAVQLFAKNRNNDEVNWLLDFVNNMDLDIYARLFTEQSDQVKDLFDVMATYKSSANKSKILSEIKTRIDNLQVLLIFK